MFFSETRCRPILSVNIVSQFQSSNFAITKVSLR